MAVYLLRLRQNIFEVTLITAFLLGLSLAYLLSKLVTFYFQEPADRFPTINIKNSAAFARTRGTLPERNSMVEIATGNLFRGTPKLNEEESVAFDLDGLTLIGILAGAARYARASIKLKNEKVAEAYAINDTVSGAKLVAIKQSFVVLENNSNERFNLYLDGENKNNKPNASAANIKKIDGENVQKIVLNRDRFNELISDQEDLFRLKFAPDIKGGKIRGWRLLDVPSDHFIHSMGARSGDTIRRYNGQELLNQDRMISMWLSLKSANQVSLDIDRGGKTIVFDITIQ